VSSFSVSFVALSRTFTVSACSSRMPSIAFWMLSMLCLKLIFIRLAIAANIMTAVSTPIEVLVVDVTAAAGCGSSRLKDLTILSRISTTS